MKKIYIPFVVFCILLACLLCPLTASAATTSYDLGLATPVGNVVDKLVRFPDMYTWPDAVAEMYTDGGMVGTWARYMSRSTNGRSYQFGNFWGTSGSYEGKNPGGDLRSYYVTFKLNLGPVKKGDQISFMTTIWLQRVGDSVDISLMSQDMAWSVDVITERWDNQTYVLEYDGTFTGNDSDYLCLRIEVDDIYGVGNINVLNFQFGADVYWACGSSLDFVAIEQQRETIKALARVEMEQQTTNERLQDLIAEQEKTNDILTKEKYQGADTSTTDEFTNAEEQLMEDTEQGREDAESILSVDSFMDNLSKLLPGILAATQIMDLCFDTIAPLQTLVYIGLALGFVSFVLGTVNMVVGSVRSANARKEREAKNDAWRKKNFNENKRYHDGMLNRRGRR